MVSKIMGVSDFKTSCSPNLDNTKLRNSQPMISYKSIIRNNWIGLKENLEKLRLKEKTTVDIGKGWHQLVYTRCET